MDKHYLTPLFTPESIVVFAGRIDAPESQHRRRRHWLMHCGRSVCKGTLQFVDIHTSGTLADLAQAQSRPGHHRAGAKDVAAALEVAGRMACRAALVISSGIDAELAAELKKIAGARACTCWAPTRWALQRPQLQLNASAAGPLAQRVAGTGVPVGRAHLVHAGLGQQQRRGFLVRGVAGAQHRRWTLRRCWTSWPTMRTPTASSSTWKASPTHAAS
jgi:hypothetical protein